MTDEKPEQPEPESLPSITVTFHQPIEAHESDHMHFASPTIPCEECGHLWINQVEGCPCLGCWTH